MNESLVPEWIREKQSEKEIQAASRRADENKQTADNLRIERDAPRYFKLLVKDLSINTGFLDRIGYRGNTESMPSFSGEMSCRVSISTPNVFEKRTHADVSFMEKEISCSILDGGMHRYFFTVDEDGQLGVMPEFPDGRSSVIDAEMLAEKIVRKMVQQLER
jgi:hypothetical protein